MLDAHIAARRRGVTEVRLIGDLQLLLGEGTLWDWRTADVWLVDIDAGRLHRHHPASGDTQSFDIGGSPAFVALAPGGGLIVGNGHRLIRFGADASISPLGHIALPAGTRINDACVDPLGRLWLGTMDVAADGGGLHRWTGNAALDTGVRCRVPNGPAFSADGHSLYHVDTMAGRVDRFDLRSDPLLQRPARFVEINPVSGRPDGITADAEDHLWICVWGAGEIRRHAPDGSLVQTVTLPATQITKLAFGGPDLKTAFVTTARRNLDAAALAREPMAGGLFAFDVETPGIRTVVMADRDQ